MCFLTKSKRGLDIVSNSNHGLSTKDLGFSNRPSGKQFDVPLNCMTAMFVTSCPSSEMRPMLQMLPPVCLLSHLRMQSNVIQVRPRFPDNTQFNGTLRADQPVRIYCPGLQGVLEDARAVRAVASVGMLLNGDSVQMLP